jgi:hypothetical protein
MKISLLSKINFFWLHIISKIFKIPLNYQEYWNERYSAGFSSGSGSYGELANFKADIINKFIQKNSIQSVIEFGCGDGNQLKLMQYKKYLGLDVAGSAIEKCKSVFFDDPSKSFFLYKPDQFVNRGFLNSDLVICLDVLYHILPEEDYIKTLDDIFSCSDKHVILYTDTELFEKETYLTGSHICHRNTLNYLKKYTDFELIEIIPNKYPDLSWAQFIILRRLTENKPS